MKLPFSRCFFHSGAALFFAASFVLGAGLAHADDIADIGKLLKGGQLDQAMQRVDGLLATKPRDAQGRFLKGLILTEQNKTDRKSVV